MKSCLYCDHMIETSRVVCITFYCQDITNFLKIESLERVYLFIYFVIFLKGILWGSVAFHKLAT